MPSLVVGSLIASIIGNRLLAPHSISEAGLSGGAVGAIAYLIVGVPLYFGHLAIRAKRKGLPLYVEVDDATAQTAAKEQQARQQRTAMKVLIACLVFLAIFIVLISFV